MRRRMAMIAGLSALCLFGAPSAAAESTASPLFGKLPAVPGEVLGSWKMVGERCEEGEATPDTRAVSVNLSLDADFRYELTVEGWRSVGTYRIDRFRDEPLRVQLADTLYEFDLVDGRLENWGEGDAAYLCGRIFERSE